MMGYLDGDDRERRRVTQRIPEPTTEKAVIFYVMRCPVCNSTRVKVYDSSKRPVRYHLCHSCGARFKSIEKL